MGNLLLPLGILASLAIVAAVVKVLVQKGKAPADYPYQKEPTLFTPAERSFLGVLEQAIGDQFRIMGKVRLAGTVWASMNSHRNRGNDHPKRAASLTQSLDSAVWRVSSWSIQG